MVRLGRAEVRGGVALREGARGLWFLGVTSWTVTAGRGRCPGGDAGPEAVGRSSRVAALGESQSPFYESPQFAVVDDRRFPSGVRIVVEPIGILE